VLNVASAEFPVEEQAENAKAIFVSQTLEVGSRILHLWYESKGYWL
jgi:hypothetical protein